MNGKKQGPQGPQKLSFLKFKKKTDTEVFATATSQMSSLLNYRWQNCKDRSNRSTNNRDMNEIAKHRVNK